MAQVVAVYSSSASSEVRMSSFLNNPNLLGGVSRYLWQPVRLVRAYDRGNLRPDLIAGLTVAVILLPQAIAFTLIAELPPQMGLYAGIIGAIVGALWGASNQMHTGPANAISLLVFSSLSAVVAPNTAEFIIGAGLMAVMVGVFQLLMGLARLGVLVNFVSHSVIVGFSTGAGLLIAIKQISPLLGLKLPNADVFVTLVNSFVNLTHTHVITAALGVGTIIFVLLVRRVNRRLPDALLAMVAGSLLVFIFKLDEQGVATIGKMPAGFPPLARLPLLDIDFIAQLSTGALAVGAIGLVETAAIARSIAAQTGQRLDSNQEFVGQGLANLFAGFFTGYPVAGSFSRSAINFGAGARTPVSALFSGLFVLVGLFFLAPLTAFVPTAALAGVLIVTAYRMVDRAEIRRIAFSTRSDALIMLVTILGTLFLRIEFAVLLGILLSFALYIRKTSLPQVYFVLPDDNFRHFVPHAAHSCPQMSLLEIKGDLYFGAVSHVEEVIQEHLLDCPEERFLLLRMHSVNQCDFSGIHALENIVRMYRERGGDVFVVRANEAVLRVMAHSGFDVYLGPSNFLSEDEAISHLFHRVLDPAICIYECPARAFRECQNLPKYAYPPDLKLEAVVPVGSVPELSARALYAELRGVSGSRPVVIDVREPREYRRGHIPEAQPRPLVTVLREGVEMPAQTPIVFVCRTGRRSRRVAYQLRQNGYANVTILQGGMLSWENAGLLEAIDDFEE